MIVRQAALLIVKVVLRGPGPLLFQSRICTIDQEWHFILNAVDYRQHLLQNDESVFLSDLLLCAMELSLLVAQCGGPRPPRMLR